MDKLSNYNLNFVIFSFFVTFSNSQPTQSLIKTRLFSQPGSRAEVGPMSYTILFCYVKYIIHGKKILIKIRLVVLKTSTSEANEWTGRLDMTDEIF